MNDVFAECGVVDPPPHKTQQIDPLAAPFRIVEAHEDRRFKAVP